MHSINVIIFVDLFLQGFAKGVAVNHTGNARDFLDKLVNRMFVRPVDELFERRYDLSPPSCMHDTMLRKSGRTSGYDDHCGIVREYDDSTDHAHNNHRRDREHSLVSRIVDRTVDKLNDDDRSSDRDSSRGSDRDDDHSRDADGDCSRDHDDRAKDRDDDRGRDCGRERSYDRSRGRSDDRSRDRDNDSFRDRSYDRGRDRDNDRGRDRGRDRSHDNFKDRDDRDVERYSERGRQRGNGRDKDIPCGRTGDPKQNERSQYDRDGRPWDTRAQQEEPTYEQQKYSTSRSGKEEIVEEEITLFSWSDI